MYDERLNDKMNSQPATVAASAVERLVMPDGYLPDFKNEPVIASCETCYHNEDVSDGYEYGGPFYACTKKGKEHMSNLKYWPFKTSQKCCELHTMYTVDWAEVARNEDRRHAEL